MKVQDVMTDEVQSCAPETNLATVAMQMWRGDFGAMPVVAGRKVVGMLTDRDICMAAATKHRDPANIRVKEVISGQVYGCSCDTDIHEALKIMQQKQVRRLPIISAEDGRLQGILSMNDVALKTQAGREVELSAEDVEQTLRAICTHRPVGQRSQFNSARGRSWPLRKATLRVCSHVPVARYPRTSHSDVATAKPTQLGG
jgi:CBS domain-containing protein